jgi:hypothetical protein
MLGDPDRCAGAVPKALKIVWPDNAPAASRVVTNIMFG